MNELKKSFNDISKKYDSQRRKLIPCFDDFYGTVVNFAEITEEHPKILDIGAGTGLLTEFLLPKFPEAEYELMDISEEMLEVAKKRFAGNGNVKVTLADYSKKKFSLNYDLIVSSLSIHHLEDEEKRKLMRKIYDSLNPGGIFINADQFVAESVTIEKKYRAIWYQKIEETDLKKTEKDAAYERMKLDRLANLSSYLKWLKETGFSDIEVLYKYLIFAVIYCKKS